MVRFFSRRILRENMSAEDAMKLWTKLREAGIPYIVKTCGTTKTGPMVRMPRTGRTGNLGSGGSYMAGGIPDSWLNNASTPDLFYTIYVNKADLARARSLCE